MAKKIMYDGSCDGLCNKCACQECEGNCAQNCYVTSHPEENAIMDADGEKGHVIDCTEYVPHLEQEE